MITVFFSQYVLAVPLFIDISFAGVLLALVSVLLVRQIFRK